MDGYSLFCLQIWAAFMTGVAGAFVFVMTGWQDRTGALPLGYALQVAALFVFLSIAGVGAIAIASRRFDAETRWRSERR